MKSLTILLTFSAGFLLVICEDYTDSEEQRINEFLEEVNKNMTEAKAKEQPVPVPVAATIGSVVSPKADQTYGMGNCNRCINIDCKLRKRF